MSAATTLVLVEGASHNVYSTDSSISGVLIIRGYPISVFEIEDDPGPLEDESFQIPHGTFYVLYVHLHLPYYTLDAYLQVPRM